MFSVYKYRDDFVAGVNHVVPDYFQDVIFIKQQGSRWDVISAERFRPQDPDLTAIRDAVKYATHRDDLKKAVIELRSKGITLEEVRNFPFPRSLIEGKKKIQAEFD